MPLFDYRCPVCQKEFDVFHPREYTKEVVCPDCQSPSRRLLSRGTKYKIGKLDFFEPYYEDNITGDPILVKSKDHLQTLCRENGLKIHKGPEKLL